MPSRLIHIAAGAMMLLVMGLPAGGSAAAPQNETQARVRKALTEGPELPWYDPVKDTVREVALPPHVEPPRPKDWQWQDEEADSEVINDWNWDLEWLWTAVQWMVWTVLALLAIYAVWLLIKAYLRGEMQGAVKTRVQQQELVARADIQRLENLPVALSVDKNDLLASAQRLSTAGEYGDAIVCLFSYQLLEMDRHHLLQLVKGKTNRQYLRELKERQSLRALIERTMLAFEDTFFGNLPITAQRFETCWAEVDRFHQLIGKQG